MSTIRIIFETLYPDYDFDDAESEVTKEYKKARKVAKAVTAKQKELYTPAEIAILKLLMQANEQFMKTPETYFNERDEWVSELKKLEGILALRGLKREYPEHTHQTELFEKS